MQTSIFKIYQTIIPNELILIYNDLKSHRKKEKNWEDLSELDLWKELCYCILSANVSYELASSTLEVLWYKSILDPKWLLNSPISKYVLLREMNSSQFYPRKKDGQGRRYRYAYKRTSYIYRAARNIYKNNSLKNILSEFDDPQSIRKYLYDNIPGLGIKETSHFLRNIHYSKEIAIIDAHVLSFLVRMNLVSEEQTLTLKRYVVLEQILLDLRSYYDLDLELLDLAIWYYMRNEIYLK